MRRFSTIFQTVTVSETVPDCLFKEEEELESDLEIDPCALSPDPGQAGAELGLDDILAALDGNGIKFDR